MRSRREDSCQARELERRQLPGQVAREEIVTV
jgi:hypothetical protein